MGIFAQVAAAAPIIVMSVYLSRTVGLEAVADFAMLIGVSSIASNVGLLGLRSRLVLDRFQVFEESDYFHVRMVASAGVVLAILVGGVALGAPLMLILAIGLMRLGDAALDLLLAIDQVRRGARQHLYGYMQGSLFKLLALLIFLAVGEWAEVVDPFKAFVAASATHTVFAWALLMWRREVMAASGVSLSEKWIAALRLIRSSVVFASAQILCALLTGAPRIALSAIPNRELAGAAGAALTVSTVIGMAYYAVWLRWVPRIGKDGPTPAILLKFAVENLALALILAVFLWVLAAPVMAEVYGIRDLAPLDTALWTLVMSVWFFLAMTAANLFKASRMPWAESGVYLCGYGAIGIALIAVPDISTPALLAVATAGMLVSELLFLPLLLRRLRR